MKKRRKLYHFADIIKDKIDFFDYQFITDKTGKKGIRYILSSKLTQEQKEKLSNYDNVIVSSCKYRFAPEIKHDTLIILK